MNKAFLVLLTVFLSFFANADNGTASQKSVEFDHQHLDGKQKFYQSHNRHFEDINNLKQSTVKEPIDVGTFFYDVNGDGKDELFIFINDHLFCGTRGCSTKVIDFSGKQPAEILNMHTYHKMHILKDKTNGYYNLGVEGDEETHIKPSLIVLYWDGVQYRRLPDAG